MGLLSALTDTEARVLADAILIELPYVNLELAHLERMPPAGRDCCYGPGILPATYGVRDDMVSLLVDTVTGRGLLWPL